jgi:threonylcarbamoyladenosine tRNA methylthiotransferase MtaB
MFENTLALVDEADLTHLHVFPFSARNGTPAARMPPVPVTVRRERAGRLRDAGARRMRDALEARKGRTISVLVEQSRTGRCEHYLPVDLDWDVAPGTIAAARVLGRDGERLTATVAA